MELKSFVGGLEKTPQLEAYSGELELIMREVVLCPEKEDNYIWHMCADGKYTVKKDYSAITQNQVSEPLSLQMQVEIKVL